MRLKPLLERGKRELVPLLCPFEDQLVGVFEGKQLLCILRLDALNFPSDGCNILLRRQILALFLGITSKPKLQVDNHCQPNASCDFEHTQ
jgi:hypothetical protein